MKRNLSLCAAVAAALFPLLETSTAAEPKIALVGGTVINPSDGQFLQDAVVLVNGDTIEAVGRRAETELPPDAKEIDCTGKFLLPGYIDTHVHFFQSADLFTRPDVVDLNSVRPYAEEVAWIKSHLDDTFARYLRSGITSVVDVGGPLWNFEVRKLAAANPKAPRVAVAGPLLSSVARPQLDLGDPPIVKIDTPEQGREMVRKLAEQSPDYIKIWYVVSPDSPVGKFRPIALDVIKESHARKLRVAVHATELEAARAAVEAGADLLVHSVTDKPVDDAFVKLLLERGTILTPTLVVFERYTRTFAHQLELNPEEEAWGNPDVIATLDVTKLPEGKTPMRIAEALENPQAVLAAVRQTYDIALANLRKLHRAGVTIATGTDAGNIGTIHGPSIFREFELMHVAGLTAQEILTCTTVNAARAFGGAIGEKIGVVEPGRFADIVILNSNPLNNIARASDINRVMKNGVLFTPQELGVDAK